MPKADDTNRGFSRRYALALGGAALVCALPVSRAMAAVLAAPERGLAFHNLHTGENLSTVYWAEGGFVPAALRDIDRMLRDWRTDEVARIDPRLFDYLYLLRETMASGAPFDVISGYRSAKTNAKLRQRSKGVARRSLHMRGMAIDISLPGRDLIYLSRAAKSLELGGVGYYPKPGFIHIDTGRVRSW